MATVLWAWKQRFTVGLAICLGLAATACAKPPEQQWHRRAPKLPPTGRPEIHVRTVDELYSAADSIDAGGTILLADGRYEMPRYFELKTDGITLRSESGNRHAVILDGKNSRHGDLVAVSACEGVTIADLTIENVTHNGFKINSDTGVHRVTIRNCVIHNVWQRGVKGVRAPENKPRKCVIEYCLFYNDRPKSYLDDRSDTAATFGGNYVAGIDIMDADQWMIRDNVFVGIQGRTREGRGAVLVWIESRECVMERNVVVDCDAGISLGNSYKGQDVAFHATACQVRNNFLTRTPEQALFAAYTRDCSIAHNSINDPRNPRRRSIRALGVNEGLVVANNLINGPPLNVPQVDSVRITGNVFADLGAAFRDADSGDLHLARAMEALVGTADRTAAVHEDFDGTKRVPPYDVGADEWQR